MRLPVPARVVPALAFLAGLVWPAAAGAQDVPRALTCTFVAGTSGAYESGVFKMQPPAPIGFAIADIDLDKLSASLDAGNGGAGGKLAIARAIGANHFLEIANEGFWTITTIYDKDPATGLHPAVHSRHLGVVGQPLVAQYTGTCVAK